MKLQSMICSILTLCVLLLSLAGCAPSSVETKVPNISDAAATNAPASQTPASPTPASPTPEEEKTPEFTAEELAGPWHLAEGENDQAALDEAFPGAMEFGSGMELTEDGSISWYIGVEGGNGTYTLEGDTLRADTTGDPDGTVIPLTLQAERGEAALSLVMEIKDLSLRWAQGEGETGKGEEEAPEEEPWKTALEKDLLEKYGVIPEYYEDLGDGIYQVYVEVGGEIVPFVTVDSATGDYHG